MLVSQGQDASTFDPGRLEFDQTYYWRVDEVNGAPDFSVFKGNVWRFTAEPIALAITGITATAGSFGASVAENTINGSGLTGDLHGTTAPDMWISAGLPASIEWTFDQAYKLHEMWVWNSNQTIEPFIGFGAKDIVIEHSVDGENWTVLEGVGPLAQATGADGYAHSNTIGFGGAVAQYVRMTVNSVQGFAPQASLSEVRFFFIPTLASRPSPVSGATDVAPDLLLSWGRNGREAGQHKIYVGSDPSDLPLAGSVNESSFDTLALDLQLGQTYAWRVDEVNEAEDPSTWTGDTWSFTTVGTIIIDDMESYKDEEFFEIWATWVDGFDDPANNGSLVGNGVTGSPETDIVHGGGKSLPLHYGNGAALSSEATQTFASAQDWSKHGIRSLSLSFHGSGDNPSGKLYVKINNTRVDYQGLSDALQRAQWMVFNIDLVAEVADLTNITSLTVGIEGGGATGVIYVDDIRLDSSAPQMIQPVSPDDNDPTLVAHYEFEGNATDTKGNYHGTAEGEPTYAPGKTGQAMVFDGIDDHVVNTFDQEVVWPAYSVSMWVKTDAFSQTVNNSPFNNNSSSSDFQFDVDGTDPGNYRYVGSATVVLGSVVDEWVQLAASCDGTSTSVYFNGLIIETVNVADNRFGQIAVGFNRVGNRHFQGMIDEVRVYNRALSSSEIAGLGGITDAVPVPF